MVQDSGVSGPADADLDDRPRQRAGRPRRVGRRRSGRHRRAAAAVLLRLPLGAARARQRLAVDAVTVAVPRFGGLAHGAIAPVERRDGVVVLGDRVERGAELLGLLGGVLVVVVAGDARHPRDASEASRARRRSQWVVGPVTVKYVDQDRGLLPQATRTASARPVLTRRRRDGRRDEPEACIRCRLTLVSRFRRHPLRLLTAVLFALGGAVLIARAQTGGSDAQAPAQAAAERAVTRVGGILANEPQAAALAAAAAAELAPSITTDLAMLSVAADHVGIERVIETGAADVTSALRMKDVVVTAGTDRRLRVWRAADGAPLGSIVVERPLVALGAGEAATLLAGADRSGQIVTVDLGDPARPALRSLRRPSAGAAPLVAFTVAASDGDGVSLLRDGTLERTDLASGDLLSRRQLPLGGRTVTTARIAAESFAGSVHVLAATADGAVTRVDLGDGGRRELLSADVAPGPIVSISDHAWDPDSAVVIGTGGGVVSIDPDTYGDERPRTDRGVARPAVLLEDEGLWVGGESGVQWRSANSSLATRPAGLPVERLLSGPGGPMAINAGGAVSLLGRLGSGLVEYATGTTPVAEFGPTGDLLVASGFDANHISELMTVRPDLGRDDGDVPTTRSYRPDPDWWDEDDASRGLYVNDVAIDDRLVAAAGQDPTSTAVVLVWDARSGRPLRRLALSTGGSEPSGPSIAASVLLLPRKHLIAAYSALQELVAVWSTDDWRQVGAIPVGAAGAIDVAPDESTIVVNGLVEKQTPTGLTEMRARLLFIDVDERRVDHEVQAGAAYRLAFSPDGKRLATLLDGGKLRLRTADGRQSVGREIALDDDQPDGLAWRPDGGLIAVAGDRPGESVSFIDPLTGDVSPVLPAPEDRTTHSLSWSPDGRRLATTTAIYDVDGGLTPEPALTWRVGSSDLRERMCALAGRPMDRATWGAQVDRQLPMRALCPLGRAAAEPTLDDARQLRGTALAFRTATGIWLADGRGQAVRVGRVGTTPVTNPLTFSWNDEGALGWALPGELHLLPPGAARARSWPCGCAGAVLTGGRLVAVRKDGSALLTFGPGDRAPQRHDLTGLGSFPVLVGVLGDKPIIAAFHTPEPPRGTPSTLYRIDEHGHARPISVRVPGVVMVTSGATSGDALAFIASGSSGVCYSTSSIGILSQDGTRLAVRYPRLPEQRAPVTVRSLHARADGIFEAAIAPVGCVNGLPPRLPPDATRYELRGDRWKPTGDRGGDVQRGTAGVVQLRTQRAVVPTLTGELLLTPTGKAPSSVATGVEQLAVRP